MTREIVSVSLGPVSRDFEFTTRMFGEDVHVRRFGADGDVEHARDLVASLDGQVDAIGLGAVNVHFRLGHRTYIHQQIRPVAQAASITPVVDGVHLKNTLERWAIGRVARQQPGIFASSGSWSYLASTATAWLRFSGAIPSRSSLATPSFT